MVDKKLLQEFRLERAAAVDVKKLVTLNRLGGIVEVVGGAAFLLFSLSALLTGRIFGAPIRNRMPWFEWTTAIVGAVMILVGAWAAVRAVPLAASMLARRKDKLAKFKART